jgi:hypothetical protein
MKTFKTVVGFVLPALCAVFFGTPAFAQGSSPGANTAAPPAAATTSQPNESQMMQQMIELSKLNENHKLLSSLDGTWNYIVKMWMNGDTGSKPQESHGTATRKSMMGGRFVMMDVSGNMEMPGPDGKVQKMEFKGHGMEGYDNVKKKFVGTWIDNMGTGIMMSEGTYDPTTKAFTYISEIEPMPGMKQQVKEVMTLTDKNHMLFEWFETRGGQEVKTMEIDYTRKK